MTVKREVAPDIRERRVDGISGYLPLVVEIVGIPGLIWAMVRFFVGASVPAGILAALALVLLLLGTLGFFMVNPNEGRVLQLFGSYVGTARIPGLRWTNPFYSKRKVSLRVRNFETGKLKVNDQRGNPVEIAAIVVWKVVDTAEAVFQVDDYANYVKVQSEAAVRNLATGYVYDAHAEGEVSLTSHTAVISQQLQTEVQDRLAQAGIEVLETRISHLAYAPEIAAAMLRRQQASAVVAARARIVEGAVGMVEMALHELGQRDVIHLDEERRAAMVSNLLVVLCSDRDTQPVVNTGTLHH
jgi:regulator of protease activity HflC (stomatin/prohibitin superfamily)